MRIRYCWRKRTPPIMGYDQDLWRKSLGLPGASRSSRAFEAVERARANTVPLLRHQPQSPGDARRTTARSALLRREMAADYADHLETHARQIERNLSAWREKEGA
jgi:hypothetical protein